MRREQAQAASKINHRTQVEYEMLKLENPHELDTWLRAKGIDPSVWGAGGSKTLGDLWNEIVTGETVLQDDPLLRVVKVVNIVIRKGKRVLMEGTQVLGTQERFRGNVPSEKLKFDENYVDAGIRGIIEELQVGSSDVEIVKINDSPEIIVGASKSYPGLRTRYHVYTLEARVKGLPDTDFWTSESHTSGDTKSIKHHWQWLER